MSHVAHINESCRTYKWVTSLLGVTTAAKRATASMHVPSPKRCHDSFIHVPWLIHTCTMTHSYMYHDSSMHVTWLIHTCTMTHSYMYHEFFIHAPWLIHTCTMTHSYMYHDSFIHVPWLIHTCTKPKTVPWRIHIHSHLTPSFPLSLAVSRCLSMSFSPPWSSLLFLLLALSPSLSSSTFCSHSPIFFFIHTLFLFRILSRSFSCSLSRAISRSLSFSPSLSCSPFCSLSLSHAELLTQSGGGCTCM